MKKTVMLLLLFTFLMPSVPFAAPPEPVDQIKADERCKVCGMFVAKYQAWMNQIIDQSGNVLIFDGSKDMFAYYFEPNRYGGEPVQPSSAVFLKDYYTLEWLDAKEAYFVVGSDVYGPMGHELIPFGSMEAAENFKKDHKGNKILKFDEVTLELINSMRVGQTMK